MGRGGVLVGRVVGRDGVVVGRGGVVEVGREVGLRDVVELDELDDEELDELEEELDVEDEEDEEDEEDVELDELEVVVGSGSRVVVGSGAGGSVVEVIGAGAFDGPSVCGRYSTLPGGGSLATFSPSRAPIM